MKLGAFTITLALLMLTDTTLVQGKETLPDGTHYYAIGYWYSDVNIKNQTLGMSGMIKVYDDKIKGAGKYMVEFVQILFSDGSWMQIGYQKKSTGERVYYYEYFIYSTGIGVESSPLEMYPRELYPHLWSIKPAHQTMDGSGGL